jgi:hypothetical protein
MSLLLGSCKAYKSSGQNSLSEKINGHWSYDAKTKVFSFDSSFENILESNAGQLKKMNKEQIQQLFGNASHINNLEKTDGSSDGYSLYYYLTENCATASRCREYFFKYDANNQLLGWSITERETQD